jgi:hypothetical protein
LKVSVLDNRDRNGIFRKQGKLHERHCHIKSLAVARNIEFKCNPLRLALASPDGTFNIAYNLRIKRGASLGI